MDVLTKGGPAESALLPRCYSPETATIYFSFLSHKTARLLAAFLQADSAEPPSGRSIFDYYTAKLMPTGKRFDEQTARYI